MIGFHSVSNFHNKWSRNQPATHPAIAQTIGTGNSVHRAPPTVHHHQNIQKISCAFFQNFSNQIASITSLWYAIIAFLSFSHSSWSQILNFFASFLIRSISSKSRIHLFTSVLISGNVSSFFNTWVISGILVDLESDSWSLFPTRIPIGEGRYKSLQSLEAVQISLLLFANAVNGIQRCSHNLFQVSWFNSLKSIFQVIVYFHSIFESIFTVIFGAFPRLYIEYILSTRACTITAFLSLLPKSSRASFISASKSLALPSIKFHSRAL